MFLFFFVGEIHRSVGAITQKKWQVPSPEWGISEIFSHISHFRVDFGENISGVP
jgi:hypothetical protein